MDAFEYKGTWWVPENPTDRREGTLNFDPVDGLSLKTTGDNFYEYARKLNATKPFIEEGKANSSAPYLDVVHGEISFLQPITLHRCWTQSHRLVASIAFVGAFFGKEEDLIFDSIRVRYTDLDEWVGLHGFTNTFQLNTERDFLDGSLEYKTPERIEYKVGKLTLSISHKLRAENFVPNDIHLKQLTYVEISSEDGSRYEDYHRETILPLREFFQVALNKAVECPPSGGVREKGNAGARIAQG